MASTYHFHGFDDQEGPLLNGDRHPPPSRLPSWRVVVGVVLCCAAAVMLFGTANDNSSSGQGGATSTTIGGSPEVVPRQTLVVSSFPSPPGLDDPLLAPNASPQNEQDFHHIAQPEEAHEPPAEEEEPVINILQDLVDAQPAAVEPTAAKTAQRGLALHRPHTNQGSALSTEDRERLGVVGLMPAVVETLQTQRDRLKAEFDGLTRPIDKYTLLARVQDTNTVLFYSFILAHLTEVLPIIYTPTVGLACQKFSHIYRPSQGMYLAAKHKGRFEEILRNWDQDVDIVVVTDGGRILGLGDLGANGMGIPLGKLALYVAGAGFNPERTLPITLDFGTNNKELLDDPLYIGQRHKRLDDEDYFALVDEFVAAVRKVWPKSLVQFEDFATPHALSLLDQHRYTTRSFNDDIQGTGSVILAGLINALKQQGTHPTDMRCVFYGAGSASIGTADMIVSWLQSYGLSADEARQRFWVIDSRGLVTHKRDGLAEYKLRYRRQDVDSVESLLEVIELVKPNVLMGLAGNGPDFTEQHVKAMVKNEGKPIIFPLSNPTSKAEVTAENAYKWTNGQVIFGAGSPFDPVTLNARTHYPAQANNMLIFPGVGFGAVLSQTTQVTDQMFIHAANALANMVTNEQMEMGLIYPPLSQLREVSAAVAVATMETAFSEGLALIERPENLLQFVEDSMWWPLYPRNVQV